MKRKFMTLGLLLMCNFSWAQEETPATNAQEKQILPLASICNMTPQYTAKKLYSESWTDTGGFPQREMEQECRLRGGSYIASVKLTDNPSPFNWYGGIRRDARRVFSYVCYRNDAAPVKTCDRLQDCLQTNTHEASQMSILYYFELFKCDK